MYISCQALRAGVHNQYKCKATPGKRSGDVSTLFHHAELSLAPAKRRRTQAREEVMGGPHGAAAAALVIGAFVAPRMMICHAAALFAALDLMNCTKCSSPAAHTPRREQDAGTRADPYHVLRLPSGLLGDHSACCAVVPAQQRVQSDHVVRIGKGFRLR